MLRKSIAVVALALPGLMLQTGVAGEPQPPASQWLPARRQRLAVAEIHRWGGSVTYSFSSRKPWLAKLIGDDFYPVVEVNLQSTRVSDSALAHLEGFISLKRLSRPHHGVTGFAGPYTP